MITQFWVSYDHIAVYSHMIVLWLSFFVNSSKQRSIGPSVHPHGLRSSRAQTAERLVQGNGKSPGDADQVEPCRAPNSLDFRSQLQRWLSPDELSFFLTPKVFWRYLNPAAMDPRHAKVYGGRVTCDSSMASKSSRRSLKQKRQEMFFRHLLDFTHCMSSWNFNAYTW